MIALALTYLSATYLLALTAAHYFGSGGIKHHHIESAAFIFAAMLIASALRRSGNGAERVEPTPREGSTRASALLFFALALVIYAPALNAGLFADDFVLIDAARQGRWTVWTELFRPVLFVVWRGLDALPGDAGPALHLANVMLHAINGALVASLARRLGLPGRRATAAGALFVCFPASVEPVAWPAGLQDVLMTTFALGYLIAVLGTQTAWRAVAAIALLVAACLTKETGITAVALGAIVCATARAPRTNWIVLGITAAIGVVLLAARLAFMPFPRTMAPLSRYAFKELLVRPFATLVVPLRSAETDAAPWLAVALVAIVVAAFAWTSRRWHYRNRDTHVVAAGTVFVLASLAAVNTLFFVSDDLLGSRLIYLGSAGWSIVLATILDRRPPRLRTAGVVIVAAMVLVWSMLAAIHVRRWTAAADVRDGILRAADRIPASGCGEEAVAGLPELVDGVPVFLNGFPELMRERMPSRRFRIDAAESNPAAPGCTLVWTGTEFRRR